MARPRTATRSRGVARRGARTSALLGVTLATSIVVGSPAVAADDAPGPESVALRPTIKKKWDYLVPNERWRPIEDSIEIGGFVFATEVKSDSKILVATKPDAKPRFTADYEGTVVRLSAETSSGEDFETAVRIRGNRQGAFSWAPAGIREGEVAGESVWIIDSNGNGSFDDVGEDSVVVGRTRGAAKLGSVWLVDDELYEVEIDASGSTLTYQPYTGEVGYLDVTSEFDMKGDLVSAVFADGDICLQLADTRNEVPVPAGRYVLEWGHVEKGKGAADIVRGEMPTIEVEPGATTVLAWGHDVHGAPDVRRGASSVTVQPTYRIWGGAGEEYVNFTPNPNPHKFEIQDADGKELESGSLKDGENVSAPTTGGG